MADANKLDMSLDDLVTSNKKPRHRRRGGAGGPQRQRGGAAPNAVNRTNAAPALDPGAKLLVSNLHFNVTEDDLKVCSLLPSCPSHLWLPQEFENNCRKAAKLFPSPSNVWLCAFAV